jgi:hypothetical protein
MTLRNVTLLLALAPALCGSTMSAHATSLATYANARFGYSVSYPADLLIPEREADNGDGRKFHARRGTAKMSVWGSYNALDQTPEGIIHDYARDCSAGKPTFKTAKPHLAAFSCTTTTGGVIYQKTLIRRDVLTSVRFEYPSAERAVWDPVVQRVSSSLKAGGGA